MRQYVCVYRELIGNFQLFRLLISMAVPFGFVMCIVVFHFFMCLKEMVKRA